MSIYEFREKYEFRGKDAETGEWRHGFLCESEYHDLMIQWIDEDGFNWYKVVPETVGQYTGLGDKNNRKIFEGDIFGITNNDERIKNRFYYVVKYIRDGFYLVQKCHEGEYGDRLSKQIELNTNYCGIAHDIEAMGFDYAIVGNIHDNPELLRVKSE